MHIRFWLIKRTIFLNSMTKDSQTTLDLSSWMVRCRMIFVLQHLQPAHTICCGFKSVNSR